jgi:hypothetical protein
MNTLQSYITNLFRGNSGKLNSFSILNLRITFSFSDDWKSVDYVYISKIIRKSYGNDSEHKPWIVNHVEIFRWHDK